MHPDEIDAREKSQKETIAKFELLFTSYAKSRNLARNCNGMGYVESALLTLIEKNAGQKHSDHILVALAGVVGDLAILEFSASFIPYNRKAYETEIEQTKDKAIKHSAK